MFQVTLTFEDGALYQFRESDEGLREGQWEYPFPNNQYDSLVFGLIENWSQSPEGSVLGVMLAHGGEPVRVSIVEIKDESEAVYRMTFFSGRAGVVEGVFFASKRAVQEAIGRSIYFGEILGKHSDVYGTLEEAHLKLLSDDPQVVKIVRDYDLSSGYDPLQYFAEDEGL